MTHSRTRHTTLVGAATAALLIPLAGLSPALADGPVEAGIAVERVEGLPDDFIHGVDVSSVLSLEESGVVFRDADGRPADLFDVLADAGVTDVRIRVWNDPFDEQGRGYGGGNVGVDRAVEIGERATDAGLEVLVNFHYSDFWADPAKQMRPKAWEGLDLDATVVAVEEFTREALQAFADAGVDVSMVQVGNETNGAVAGFSGWTAMTRIFAAGSRAVREVLPEAQVAIHFTNPEHAGRYATAAAELARADVDYDVFASSYYPFWHGSLDNLTTVLSAVADTHDKDVMVAETSWVHTLADGDGHPNTIDQASQATAHPISVQGQASAVRDVIAAVVDVGAAGIGVYYWEPAWLPVGPPSEIENNRRLWEEFGSGWATSFAGEYDEEDAGEWFGGTSWDNQALFAADGTPLESLNVFRHVRTGTIAERAVTDIAAPTLTVTEGDTITLPGTVAVSWNDGTTEDQAVVWADALQWIEGPGRYTITGTTSGGLETEATIVVERRNVLANPGFEDDDTSMWELTGSGATLRSTDDPRSGTRSTHFWSEGPYTFTLGQTVTGLAPGDYEVTAAVQGDGEAVDSTTDLVLSDGSTTLRGAFSLTGWQNWSMPVVGPLTVTDPAAEITVRLVMDLPGGAWGTIDDFSLRLVQPAGADTGELEALLADAEVLASDDAALVAAMVRAAIVLGADAPSAQAVGGALEQLRAAIDALETPQSPTPQPTSTVTATATATATATVTATATATASATVTPSPGHVDVYATPGFHQVGGRWWNTACEPYSQTIRCRTEIWATVAGSTGWHFNNLTYLPHMTRAQWGTNPLANHGAFTSAGRQWRTECDTPATGRGGCRSWIRTTVDGWVLNNIVRFRN